MGLTTFGWVDPVDGIPSGKLGPERRPAALRRKGLAGWRWKKTRRVSPEEVHEMSPPDIGVHIFTIRAGSHDKFWPDRRRPGVQKVSDGTRALPGDEHLGACPYLDGEAELSEVY